ncbi:glycoside hydrolase family 19 protein [Robbsia andropogonis]|uniref:glycoside hydrolase family 19 protein n=1 Tax=Robbsia andropogonis TaxID=28092 RepID=UPI00209D37A1|nr:glycoside hydrolase family 19 protein [Robbsia andropogonis]MCP1120126.1 glycoside hydrolase family 19 protein [Robbsia andropogonis]MCP1130042.1 glycoside hydrolase family 19 protein [Robbsia andropogonis]
MTPAAFQRATGVNSVLAARWCDVVSVAMFEFGINTPAYQAAFLAQIAHESIGFTTLVESFNYSVAALTATFGPTGSKRLTLAQCEQLGRAPNEKAVPIERQQQIANIVYGGRGGNRLPGDGWTFRGRGLIQNTFRENYEKVGTGIDVDLIVNPDLLMLPEHAARGAAYYWRSINGNGYVDRNDFTGLTKAINGGTNGLADRTSRWEVAKNAMGVIV